MEHSDPFYSLIPLPDFKAILGIDDRKDALSRYCLITAAFTIEQYCKRRLLRRKHTDYLTFSGDPIFTLREYPVRKVLSVHAATSGAVLAGRPPFEMASLISPEHYCCLPDEGIHEDIPFSLVLRPPLRLCPVGKGLYVSGIRRGTLRERLPLTWPRLVWNWRRGTWPATGGGGLA